MISGTRIQQGLIISALIIFVLLLSSCGDSSKVAGDESAKKDFERINWGRETTAGEIVAMAKIGEIREIEWHVMPNIIRAVASDGRIFHVKNENKGIDLRGMLVKAGVKVGKGGVDFRHVF